MPLERRRQQQWRTSSAATGQMSSPEAGNQRLFTRNGDSLLSRATPLLAWSSKCGGLTPFRLLVLGKDRSKGGVKLLL